MSQPLSCSSPGQLACPQGWHSPAAPRASAQTPAGLERDLAPENKTSNSAWTLESQVWVPPAALGGTVTHSSSPKATGQSAASCQALSQPRSVA